MKKRIAIVSIIIYTILNLYVFKSFVFSYWWHYTMISGSAAGGGMIIFSLLISLFLNTALIIYYAKEYERY